MNTTAHDTAGMAWRPVIDGWLPGVDPKTGMVSTSYALGTFVTPSHLCPDLLRYEQLGAADNWRGRMVRGFFFLMRVWSVT